MDVQPSDKMSTLTNSEDPDECHKCCISSGYALFVKVKIIFRDIKHQKIENVTCEPLFSIYNGHS